MPKAKGKPAVTRDPVVRALVDLVHWIETNRDAPSITNPAYLNAVKALRDCVAPSGEYLRPEEARTAWTVEKCYDYEGCDVVGVYNSKKEADAAVVEFRKEYDLADDWRVQEFAVPTPTPEQPPQPRRTCPRCGVEEGEKCRDYNHAAQRCNNEPSAARQR